MRYLVFFAILMLAACQQQDEPRSEPESGVQVATESLAADSLSGRYSWKEGGSEAELTLQRVDGKTYNVQGEAYWGVDRLGGPHIGEVNFIAPLQNGVIEYQSKDTGYRLCIEWQPGVLVVTEDGLNPDAGLNVSFAGTYQLIK